MSASVNSITIIGNLGGDPEQYGDGTVTKFSVATTTKWKDRDGQEQARTDWHKVVVFGKNAESCYKYLKKGSQVYVDGSMQYGTYENKDGHTVPTAEIKAYNVQFLAKWGKEAEGATETSTGYQRPPGVKNHADEINF